jgi:hypothetical protein
MIDADEGRRPPGTSTTLLKLIYNSVIMAPTYPLYRRAEARRQAGRDAATAEAPPRGLAFLVVLRARARR